MNFMEAVKAMKEGKKVVSQSEYSATLYLKGGVIFNDANTDVLCLRPSTIEATDWEIYEEEDNWNYVDEIERMKLNIVLEPFKTFIQKVKEDMEEEGIRGLEQEEVIRIIDKRAGDLK